MSDGPGVFDEGARLTRSTLSVPREVLYHAVEDGELERLIRLAHPISAGIALSAAGVFLGCVPKIAQAHLKEIAPEERPAFDHLLLTLQINSFALQVAALEDDEVTVVHWYFHVKQACAGCHARFWNVDEKRAPPNQ